MKKNIKTYEEYQYYKDNAPTEGLFFNKKKQQRNRQVNNLKDIGISPENYKKFEDSLKQKKCNISSLYYAKQYNSYDMVILDQYNTNIFTFRMFDDVNYDMLEVNRKKIKIQHINDPIEGYGIHDFESLLEYIFKYIDDYNVKKEEYHKKDLERSHDIARSSNSIIISNKENEKNMEIVNISRSELDELINKSKQIGYFPYERILHDKNKNIYYLYFYFYNNHQSKYDAILYLFKYKNHDIIVQGKYKQKNDKREIPHLTDTNKHDIDNIVKELNIRHDEILYEKEKDMKI